MKKWVSGILLCAAVSLAACGNKNASSGEGTEKAAEAGESRDSLGGQQENAANASKVYQIGFMTARWRMIHTMCLLKIFLTSWRSAPEAGSGST